MHFLIRFRFKEVSPLCPQAGFFLINSQYSSVVKHFGLQLIEYTVKFNWNNISQQEKVYIKVSCFTSDSLRRVKSSLDFSFRKTR